MKLFSTIYICCLVFLSHLTLFSQTPIQKWEFVKTHKSLNNQFLHGYNVCVSKEGYTFVSCDQNLKHPTMISVSGYGIELFSYELLRTQFDDFFYKTRIEANDIYRNCAFDGRNLFGIQNTWIDSSSTNYSPVEIYFSRASNDFVTSGKSFFGRNNTNFHSTINTSLNDLIKFISIGFMRENDDSITILVNTNQLPNTGELSWYLDSISLGTIHKDDFVSLPKPQAMRWYTKNRQLGMMISPDTVIPTSYTFTQIRVSTKLEKFDQMVDVNPYLVENFAGKRLRWKGFTNSSFGFVALYENIDDNNRNILIRYNTATQQFTTVPLDVTVDCRSLCIDSIGALAIVGTKNNAGNNDFYLGYFNSMGELSEQSWGGEEYDRLNDCVIDSLGEIAVSGQKGNDLYLAKFTFNATSVSDKGANSVPSIFIHQGGSSTANNELVVDNLASGNTIIRMYTMQGTFVGTIYEGMILEGASYRFPIPSSSISNGVYLIVLENNGITQTKQFVVVK